MGQNGRSRIPELLRKYETDLLAEWIQQQIAAGPRSGRIEEAELRAQCRSFLSLLREAIQDNDTGDIATREWQAVRDLLSELSRSRGIQGFSPSETATFVFSLK